MDDDLKLAQGAKTGSLNMNGYNNPSLFRIQKLATVVGDAFFPKEDTCIPSCVQKYR